MTKPLSQGVPGLSLEKDEGHTKACPLCACRFGNNPFKRGKPRDVTLEPCATCKDKVPVGFDKNYRRVRL